MSKTDKTCPWLVRAMTNPDAYLVPVHHHELRACTLPELTFATLQTHQYGHTLPDGSRGCGWHFTTEFLLGRDSGCACNGCSDRHQRRADRRRSRHTWRQTEARLNRGRNAPDDIFDGVLADTDSYDERYTALAATIASTLDLPDGSRIVDLEDTHDRFSDNYPYDDHELVRAEVMHNDGAREWVDLPAGVGQAHTMTQLLGMACPTVARVDEEELLNALWGPLPV